MRAFNYVFIIIVTLQSMLLQLISCSSGLDGLQINLTYSARNYSSIRKSYNSTLAAAETATDVILCMANIHHPLTMAMGEEVRSKGHQLCRAVSQRSQEIRSPPFLNSQKLHCQISADTASFPAEKAPVAAGTVSFPAEAAIVEPKFVTINGELDDDDEDGFRLFFPTRVILRSERCHPSRSSSFTTTRSSYGLDNVMGHRLDTCTLCMYVCMHVCM